MKSWWIYVRERFPIPVYCLLIFGIVLSGMSLAPSHDGVRVFEVALALLIFFAELRLMDEQKDYQKDLIAHPERPLPRGVLDMPQVNRAILAMTVTMVALGALFNWMGAFLYWGVTLYLWLMYKEFYVGRWLSDRPILYAITHQLILIPLCLFAGVSVTATPIVSPQLFYYSVGVLGSFFTYEVCRKLDPLTHPILKTYLALYGPKGTSILVVGTSLVAALGAWRFGGGPILWPMEAMVLLSLSLLLLAPSKYKWVEGVATLSLLVHLYAGWLLSRFGGGAPS